MNTQQELIKFISVDDYFWQCYHAARVYKTATGQHKLTYIRTQMKKDIPDLLERYFDGSNKKFMLWAEDKFINKH